MKDSMKINGCTLRVEKGDITAMEIEAFAFYARNDLKLGSGFGNAIATRGGLKIQEELNALAPVADGQAVVSEAGMLKAKNIVHAVGPKFQEPAMPAKLKDSILNALKTAEEKGIKQIAFPPMGAGFYGVPLAECASIMMNTFKEYIEQGTSIEEIIVVVLNKREYKPFQSMLG